MSMSGGYRVIYADPPWSYETWSKKGAGRTASSHYDVMKTADIAALPVASIAARDSVLLMWATFPNLPDAMKVMEGWGFEYKTVLLTWVKMSPLKLNVATGLGHYTRANAEILLLGRRGSGVRRACKNVQQILIAPRRAHSAKPSEARQRIERLFGDVPRVELFARRRPAGWDVLGNAIDGRDIRDVLAERAA